MKSDLPKNKLTKIDTILADRMWFIEQELNAGQNIKDVLSNAKDELEDTFTTLIHQAEKKARIDELVKVNYFIVKHSSSLLLPPPSDIKNNINDRISVLEKEIV